MKTLFVDQIKPDTGTFDDFFQVSAVDRKNTGKGKPFLSLKLRDKTGEVSAKLWDIPEDLPELKPGAVVKVRAESGTYREDLQLKVLKLRLAEADEASRDDYMPASKRDRDEMRADLGRRVLGIEDEALQLAVADCLASVSAQFKDAPAAKSNHQAYLGGLLEHVLVLCALVDGVCTVYPDLNRDVMIAGAIVHDIGKVHELCYEDHIGYTRAGALTGHVVQGSILWAQYSGKLDPATRDHVQHIIVSHHGTREWGAPVLPMTREAQIFHLLDMIDSRYEMMTNALAEGVDADGLTSWNHKLGGAVWNGQ